MYRQPRHWPTAIFVALLTAVALAAVQDPKAKLRAPDPEVFRRAQQLARTTPEHERLQRLAGRWNVAVTTHAAEGRKFEDRGTAVGQAILGGRYVVVNLKLKVQGNDVEAVQIVGYDTLRTAYTSSWRDDASTWPVECMGEVGAVADLLVMRGTLHDARTPSGRPFRTEIDLREQDRVVVKVFEMPVQGDLLLQEMVWTRT